MSTKYTETICKACNEGKLKHVYQNSIDSNILICQNYNCFEINDKTGYKVEDGQIVDLKYKKPKITKKKTTKKKTDKKKTTKKKVKGK